jgi:hypothetical protein
MAKEERKIQGTARLAGQTFVEGEEDLLDALAEEQGVSVDRAYGVDSTEKRSERKLRGPEQRAAALARKAERDGAKGKADLDELLSTGVDELPDALAGVTNIGDLQKLKRRETRVTAKPLIQDRIDALKAEKDAAEAGESAETE